MACVRSGISGWVIGLLIRGRAGRRTARGQSWSPVLADSEARRCFLFGTWRSAVAELFGNSRSQQLAAGQPSDVLALCWILALAERDRSLNSARQGVRVNCLLVAALARARNCLGRRFRSAAPARSYGVCSAAPARSYGGRFGASRSKTLAEGRVNCLLVAALARARNCLGRRFRSAAPARSYGVCSAAPARSYGDCSARADRKRWPRGGCGVCALWHFRLGDRALDPWACGRRTARGQ